MIVENVGNQTANQKKTLEVRIISGRKYVEQFEPIYSSLNFKCLLKIEGSLTKFLNIKRLLSIPSPLKQYQIHVILIW